MYPTCMLTCLFNIYFFMVKASITIQTHTGSKTSVRNWCCLLIGRCNPDKQLLAVYGIGVMHQSRRGSRILKWGVNFLNLNQRNQILFQYLRDKKKKERRGLRKRGVEIHPFHLLLTHAGKAYTTHTRHCACEKDSCKYQFT